MQAAADYIRVAFSEKGKRRDYFVLFTLAFFVVCFFCYIWFIIAGKSFIWNIDGWKQHFKALIYYSRYLRSIAVNLIKNHKLIIPDWDYTISEGSDIVNTLHYYVIGDPLNLLSVFVPGRYMQYFYTGGVILRIYLSGVVFSVLCFDTGISNRRAVMAGALSYALCSWTCYSAVRHPFFVNPMIYFPLLILGIEKIIQKRRPYLFIAAVAISGASNFYFFYVIAVLAVVYALIRLFLLYKKDVKQAIMKLLYMGVMAVIGVCISGVILLPIIMVFMRDSRIGNALPFRLFYPSTYYTLMPAILITHRHSKWLCIGFTAPVVLAMALMFMQRKKEEKLFRILTYVCCVIIIFPIMGRILNGMSYATNRWAWAFSLLAAYILAIKWDDLIGLSFREWRKLAVFVFIYLLAIMFLAKSRNPETLSALTIVFIALMTDKIVVKGEVSRTWHEAFLLLSVAASLVNMYFWQFSPQDESYTAEFYDSDTLWSVDWKVDETKSVKKLTDSKNVRYSGRNLTTNAGMVKGISTTQYYFSLSIPSVSRYRDALRMREPLFQCYAGYDDRTTPIALSASQFYVTKDGDNKSLPYGCKLVGEEKPSYSITEKYAEELQEELGVDSITAEQKAKISSKTKVRYNIYENPYALPLGYCYDRYITSDTWEKMNAVEKQEIQLSAAVLDKPSEGVEKFEGALPEYEVPYELETETVDITQTGDNSFVTTSKNAVLVLRLPEGVERSEIYVELEGIEFTPTKSYDLYFGSEDVDPRNLYNKVNWDLLEMEQRSSIRQARRQWDPIKDTTFTISSSDSEQKSKKIEFSQPDSPFSSGRQNFIANLGYTDKDSITVKITCSGRGIYNFSGIRVYRIPMDDFPRKIEALKSCVMENIKIGTDSIKGEVNADTDKILCVATPYIPGWRVYVDGAEKETLCVNSHYIGVEIPAGEHEIQFKYSRQYKKLGMAMSLAGFLGLFVTAALYERSRRKSKAPKS